MLDSEEAKRLGLAAEVFANPLTWRILARLQTPHAITDFSDFLDDHDVQIAPSEIWGILDTLRQRGLVKCDVTVRDGGNWEEYSIHKRQILALATAIASVAPAPNPTTPTGPHLRVVGGWQHGLTFPLKQDTKMAIGRNKDHPICLDFDAAVSSTHATVVLEGRILKLSAMAPIRTQVEIDGQPIRGEISIRPRSVILIGRTALQFDDGRQTLLGRIFSRG